MTILDSVTEHKNAALKPMLEAPDRAHDLLMSQFEIDLQKTVTVWKDGSIGLLLSQIATYYEGFILTNRTNVRDLVAVNRFLAKSIHVITLGQPKKISDFIKNYGLLGRALEQFIIGNDLSAYAYASTLYQNLCPNDRTSSVVFLSVIAKIYYNADQVEPAMKIWAEAASLDETLSRFSIWGPNYLSALYQHRSEAELEALLNRLEQLDGNSFVNDVINWYQVKDHVLNGGIAKFKNMKSLRKEFSTPIAQIDLWLSYLETGDKKLKKLLFTSESTRKYADSSSVHWQLFRPAFRVLGRLIELFEKEQAGFNLNPGTASLMGDTKVLPTKDLKDKVEALLIGKMQIESAVNFGDSQQTQVL